MTDGSNLVHSVMLIILAEALQHLCESFAQAPYLSQSHFLVIALNNNFKCFMAVLWCSKVTYKNVCSSGHVALSASSLIQSEALKALTADKTGARCVQLSRAAPTTPPSLTEE